MDEAERFVAAKPFNTANRRIAEGEIITRADVEAGDRDFDVLRQRGFVAGYDTKRADRAAAKAKEAGDLILADRPAPTPAPETGEAVAPTAPAPAQPAIKRPARRR